MLNQHLEQIQAHSLEDQDQGLVDNLFDSSNELMK